MDVRDVAMLWFSLAAQEWDLDLHAALVASGCLTALARHDEQVLTAAAHAAMAGGRSLTRAGWERCVDDVREQAAPRWRTSAHASGRSLDLEQYLRVCCLVDHLDAAPAPLLDDLLRRFGAPRVERARSTLLDRVLLRGDTDAGLAVDALPDALPDPLPDALPGSLPDSLPVLAVDADELVVVHLLALSRWACRFSFDAEGRAFAGPSRLHPRAGRVRVDALSPVLDWVGGRLREGAGCCPDVVVHGERVRCGRHVHDLGRLLSA